MRTVALLFALLLASLSAHAAYYAIWTGESRAAFSVTGRPMTVCTYDLFGQRFERGFAGSVACPYRVNVE